MTQVIHSAERMPRRAFVAWLNDVERAVPVADWTARGIRVWPLVRLEIYAVNCGALITRHSLVGSRWDHARVLWNAASAWTRAVFVDRRANVEADRPADAVFLACSTGIQPLIGGKRYNTRLVPYASLLEQLGERVTVWEMSPYSVYNTPRYTPSFFIQPYIFWQRISTAAWRPGGATPTLPGHDDFVARLAAAGLASRYTNLTVLDRDAYFVRRLADGFKRWLGNVHPTLGFVGDYGFSEQAFCLACRELGITSVEIQHGSQGQLHPAYGRWAAVPPDGYETRPQVYWCWDDESAQAINDWAAPYQHAHMAVVGGDAWRELWQDDNSDLVREFSARLAEMKDGEPATTEILVTTSNVGDVIPTPVLEAMVNSPRSWRYWVRVHPVDQQTRLPAATALLRQHGVRHADTIRTTQMPLHALLRNVDLHVSTSWSTVILEAEAFGVPSIACSDDAREMFPQQLRTGMLQVANATSNLLEVLQRHVARAKVRVLNGRRASSTMGQLLTLRTSRNHA